jgi:hypothetical protein
LSGGQYQYPEKYGADLRGGATAATPRRTLKEGNKQQEKTTNSKKG